MVAVRNIDFFGTQCTSSYHTMVLLMDFVHTDKHWNSPCNFVQLCSWVSRIKQYRYLTFATPSRSRVTWCSITEFITNVSTRNIPYKMLFTTITLHCVSKNVLPLTCYNLLHKITKRSYYTTSIFQTTHSTQVLKGLSECMILPHHIEFDRMLLVHSTSVSYLQL